jgi:hypothetical protein
MYSLRFLLFSVFGFLFILHAFGQTTVNYQSVVAQNESSSFNPFGIAQGNLGPYTAYDRVWVFYSDGTNAVLRTKPAEEGGSWSAKSTVFSAQHGNRFNVAFDGQFFHFVRVVDGNIRYLRAAAEPDGDLVFETTEQVAWSDATFNADGRYLSIAVDGNKNPWIVFQAASGSNRKPVVISSTAADGTWVDRDEFPQDLQSTNTSEGHGFGVNVANLGDSKMLFTWRDEVNNRISARVWNNGVMGDLENTGLSAESERTSVVKLANEIALINAGSNVVRRNADDTYTNVTPPTFTTSDYNALTEHNGIVRIWDFSSNNLRFSETTDQGDSWSSATNKWAVSNLHNFSATQARGSHGDHHSVVWSSGSSPYSIAIGIDGTFHTPGVPVLTSPLNGADNVSIHPTLMWGSDQSVETYSVQVATDVDFANLVVDATNLDATSYELTDLTISTTYYWRVRITTAQEIHGEWSEVWNFTTIGIPPAPVLTSPSDGAVDVSTSPTLVWGHISGVDTYQLQVSAESTFVSTFLNVEGITQSSFDVSGLDTERTYYWRVRGSNQFGQGDWSTVWSFTTRRAVPAAPVLVSPEDGTVNTLTTLTLTWGVTEGAASYRVQVSKVSNFTSTVVNVGNVTDTSYQVSGLEHSTIYYWRVNATNESGTGGWSAVRSFTTIIGTPEVPILVSPMDSAETVSPKPVFQWNESARAQTYRLQVALDMQFSDLVIDQVEIDSLRYAVIDELNEFTNHYWRVNATNIGGTSDWSEVWQFTTGRAFPVAPTLLSPANGGTDVTNALMLWNSVATATHYRIQIAKSDDFASPAVDNASVANTFYEATNLEKFTQYFWRVRAISDVGAGDWSLTWSFTTGDIVSVERFGNEIPTEFALGQNYPNPFNPTTRIQFALPQDATVRIEVYNMLGQRIATLIDGQYFNAGIFETEWNARDDSGHEVSSGLYIYRISAGDYVNVKKMMFTK